MMLLVAFWITGVYLLVAFNSLGRYSIGGEPNSWLRKIIVLACCVIPLFAWYAVVTVAPFSVTLT